MTNLSQAVRATSVAAAFFLICGAARAAEPTSMTWSVQGVERQALVFAPAAGGARAPVVFVFHGHGDTMHGAANGMGFQERWPEAVVVYMQGLPTVSKVDPEGRERGWQHDVGDEGDRDLHFFDTALAALRARYPIDDRRIYATGFSNGAAFSYVLWSARGSTLAAIAACAGRIAPGFQRATNPVPLLHIAGKTDKLVPFDVQMRTVDAARGLDGADGGEGASCGEGCTRYASTKKAPVVVLVHPGGHVFPSFAATRIVEFFKMQTLSR
jgi:polyhydroxybutyrate depolymerase